MNEKRPFLGTGWAFPPSFDKSDARVHMVSDEEDIRQSLQILLTTSLGERVMLPRYGCNLRDYLHEPLDTSLQAYLKDLIHTAILYHEPRIRMLSLGLKEYSDEGLLEIHLEYLIRATNSRFNFVFPFYKNEGSEVPR